MIFNHVDFPTKRLVVEVVVDSGSIFTSKSPSKFWMTQSYRPPQTESLDTKLFERPTKDTCDFKPFVTKPVTPSVSFLLSSRFIRSKQEERMTSIQFSVNESLVSF